MMHTSLIETVSVALPPVLFLSVLFGGEALFKRRNIDMGGKPPIPQRLFAISKYSIIFVWGAMILQACEIGLSFADALPPLKLVSLSLWFIGFAILLAGRIGEILKSCGFES